MLDDVVSQPAVVDPSSEGGRQGGRPPRRDSPSNSRVLLLRTRFARLRGSWRQRRCRTRATRGARVGRCSAAAAAPGAGAVVRTGLGVGHGVFDAVYVPPAEDAPLVRFGRGYSDKKRWTEKEAQDLQAALTDSQ